MLPSLQSLSLCRRRGSLATGAPPSNDKYLQDKYDSGRPFYDDPDSDSNDDADPPELSEKARGKLPAKEPDGEPESSEKARGKLPAKKPDGEPELSEKARGKLPAKKPDGKPELSEKARGKLPAKEPDGKPELSEKARGKLPAEEPDGKSVLDALRTLKDALAPIRKEEKKSRERRAGGGGSDTALNEKKPVENTPKQKKLEEHAKISLLGAKIALGVVTDTFKKQTSAENTEDDSKRSDEYKRRKRVAEEALWRWRRETVPAEESTDIDTAVREGTDWVASKIIQPYLEANGEAEEMYRGSLKVWAHLESIVNEGLYAEAVYVVDKTNAFYRDMDADRSDALVFQEYTVAYLRKAFLGLAFNNNAAYRFADFVWARNDALDYFNSQIAVLKSVKEMRELATRAGFFEPLLLLESTLNKELRTDDLFYKDRRLFDPRTVPRNQVVATVDRSLHMYVQLKAAYESLVTAYNGAAESLGAVVPDALFNMMANLHYAMQMASNVLRTMDGALPDKLLRLYTDSSPPVRDDGTKATKEWYERFHDYFRTTCENLFGRQS